MANEEMIFKIASILVLVTCCYGQQHPACQIWKSMAHQLSTQKQRQMTCYANDTNPCTSLRCTGTYKYTSWLLPEQDNEEVDYCFGMRLNHCDNPVSMDIYLNVPSKKISYAKKISHNTLLQVPGFSFTLKNLGTVDVFLYFHMVRIGAAVNMSIITKVRIKSSVLEMWPKEMQKQIVPNEQIPVPPCTSQSGLTTQAPIHVQGQCHPPTWAPPTGGTEPPPPKGVTFPPKSITFNKTCSDGRPFCSLFETCNLALKRCVCKADYQYNTLHQVCVSLSRYNQQCSNSYPCWQNEVCISSVCVCQRDFTYSQERQLCMMQRTGGVTLAPVKTVTSSAQHHTAGHSEPSMAPPANNIPLIVGASIGGVVFLVLVSLFVVFMVRRARNPYQNREMLLSDDTDGIM